MSSVAGALGALSGSGPWPATARSPPPSGNPEPANSAHAPRTDGPRSCPTRRSCRAPRWSKRNPSRGQPHRTIGGKGVPAGTRRDFGAEARGADVCPADRVVDPGGSEVRAAHAEQRIEPSVFTPGAIAAGAVVFEGKGAIWPEPVKLYPASAWINHALTSRAARPPPRSALMLPAWYIPSTSKSNRPGLGSRITRALKLSRSRSRVGRPALSRSWKPTYPSSAGGTRDELRPGDERAPQAQVEVFAVPVDLLCQDRRQSSGSRTCGST